MSAPRVVGVDLSLASTGLADSQGRVERVQTKATDGSLKADLRRQNSIIGSALDFIGGAQGGGRAALVVIEGPAYGTNLPSTHDRAGLWWGLLSGLLAAQIPTAVVNPKTRAKWATGKGNAQKPDVLAAVRNQWPDTRVPNHDCADALVMASMGALWSGWTLPFDVQTWQHNGLQSVTWPERTQE